jgi:AcrR family transcriptional regulator
VIHQLRARVGGSSGYTTDDAKPEIFLTATHSSPAPAPDKRALDQRWLRTRERLLTAGFELIGEGGAEGASIDALVARAGISKQTFYNHFSDRDELTAALSLESRRVLQQAIAATNADVLDPVLRLARGVATYARQAVVHPVLTQFVARTTISRGTFDEGNRGLEQDIAAGVAQGRLQVDHPATAVMFVVGVTATLIAQITASSNATAAEMLCREVLTMLLRALGCGGEEGRQIAAQAAHDVVAGGEANTIGL